MEEQTVMEGPWTLTERGSMLVRIARLIALGHEAASEAFMAVRKRPPPDLWRAEYENRPAT